MILCIIALINFIFNIKRKTIYIKFCCAHKLPLFLSSIIVFPFLFTYSNIIGILILSIIAQIILKSHFAFMEEIYTENNSNILNYIENNYDTDQYQIIDLPNNFDNSNSYNILRDESNIEII